MTDLSLVDDDDIDLPGDEDGEGNETEGRSDGDEGQEGDAEDEGGDAGEEGDEEGLAEPAPRRARQTASERVRESRAQVREANERAARLEREIAEIRAQQQRGPSAEEIRHQQAVEAERLSLMSPDERADYRIAQAEHRLRNEMQQTRLQLAEQADQSSFRALQATNPLARKYATDVEKVVADQKARGMIVNREVALKFVLGEKLYEKSMATGGKAKKAGAARVAAQTGNPGRAAGQATSERGSRRGDDSEAALERRLAGVRF